MRGSREISVVPSLHRASTDALILRSKPVVLNRCCWIISGLGHTCFRTFLKVELQVYNNSGCN